MISATYAAQAAFGRAVTQPGWLLRIDWPGAVLRWSSLGIDVAAAGQVFLPGAFRVDQLSVDGVRLTGTLSLANADFRFNDRVRYPLAGVSVALWVVDAGALADSDVRLVGVGVLAGGQAAQPFARLSVATATARSMCPRAVVNRANGFNWLTPAGASIALSGGSYLTLERAGR